MLPTPFLDDRIDFESLERLFDHVFPELEGCTLGGSTGEAVSLSTAERIELMRWAVANAPRGKTIVVGLTHTNLKEAATLARTASELGVHAGLIPCPYYFPNSFPMVLEYLRALDAASDLPLVFYDNPLFTKTFLTAEELFRLVDACPHLNAVKMTDHNLAKISALKSKGVDVFSGDDVVAFRSLLLGVAGSMIIAPSVFPAAYQLSVRLLASGKPAEALRVFSERILPFIHLFGPGDEVQVTKAVFHRIGIFQSPEARLPLLPCPPARVSETMLAYDLCMAQTSIPQSV